MVRQLKRFTNSRIFATNINSNNSSVSTASHFNSWLPQYYDGLNNRVARYGQYDQMDMDSDICAALDTIAEFCTQTFDENEQIFTPVFSEYMQENEKAAIIASLEEWCEINDWNNRMFDIFRNVLKYGDQPFIRDPKTFVLYWLNPADVVQIVTNMAEGRKDVIYEIKNIELDIDEKTLSGKKVSKNLTGLSGPAGGGGGAARAVGSQLFSNDNIFHVDANEIVHLALTNGTNSNAPFGDSVLDRIFKTYKQKELLEDASIIYRVQRAPERRVFSIYTGNMPAHMATHALERTKNAIHQRRIPNNSGGSTSVLDAQYNPLGHVEDYFFSVRADGKGSSVSTLPGGDQLGKVGDLEFFSVKFLRGLGIPQSYLPFGVDDTSSSFNNGKVGTAHIEEFRFNKKCLKFQGLIQKKLDSEFKRYLHARGQSFDESDAGFFIKFREPQSFSDWRQIDIDSAFVNLYKDAAGIPQLSKRFAMKKYLGLSDQEIQENAKLWLEENPQESASEETESSHGGSGGGGFGDFGAETIIPGGGDFEGEIDSDNLDDNVADSDGSDADEPAPPSLDNVIKPRQS